MSFSLMQIQFGRSEILSKFFTEIYAYSTHMFKSHKLSCEMESKILDFDQKIWIL